MAGVIDLHAKGFSRHETKGVVYFIQGDEGGLIKIGYTSALAQRLPNMQMNSPVVLRVLVTVPGTGRLEDEFHVRFRHLCERGEWHRPERELLEFIAGLATALAPQMSAEEVHKQRWAAQYLPHPMEVFA